MPKPYSYDLRQKVIQAIKLDGLKITEASILFSISRDTIFVEVNGDKTQVEMAKLWAEEISDRTISRALKKIGFTRKKKLMVIKKGMRLNELYLKKR